MTATAPTSMDPPPGTAFLRLVAVMDRLRSPGGCPWDAEQDHRSLAPFLLEETYETLEAIETGDRAHLVEELGDLLLQVVFHARVAQEDAHEPFGIDDVADAISDKLVRRHPHVFGQATAATADAVEQSWERLKAAEKRRESVLDGIPAALPALARAAKVVIRLRRAGLEVVDGSTAEPVDQRRQLQARLLAAVDDAVSAGLDPETVLREATNELAAAGRAAELAERGRASTQ